MSLRITARGAKGFRRCGVHHTPEPTLYPDSFFSPEEIERLTAEPQLVVELQLDDDSPADRSHLSLTEGGLSGGTETGAGGKAPVTIELPSIAKLAGVLQGMTDRSVIDAMWAVDTRKSAVDIYAARIKQLTDQAGE